MDLWGCSSICQIQWRRIYCSLQYFDLASWNLFKDFFFVNFYDCRANRRTQTTTTRRRSALTRSSTKWTRTTTRSSRWRSSATGVKRTRASSRLCLSAVICKERKKEKTPRIKDKSERGMKKSFEIRTTIITRLWTFCDVTRHCCCVQNQRTMCVGMSVQGSTNCWWG